MLNVCSELITWDFTLTEAELKRKCGKSVSIALLRYTARMIHWRKPNLNAENMLRSIWGFFLFSVHVHNIHPPLFFCKAFGFIFPKTRSFCLSIYLMVTAINCPLSHCLTEENLKSNTTCSGLRLPAPTVGEASTSCDIRRYVRLDK